MKDHAVSAEAAEQVATLRGRLDAGLETLDPHHRLRGRPVSYHVLAGPTLEIVYKDVARIEESEVLGVKRLLGTPCYCIVEPQTAETLTVRFVVPLGKLE